MSPKAERGLLSCVTVRAILWRLPLVIIQKYMLNCLYTILETSLVPNNIYTKFVITVARRDL